MDIEKELQNVLKLSPFRNHYKNDDNFLKLLSKITTKVTTKYNLKVEDLKSVIHEFENHYHKSCLNFERKNDVNYKKDNINLYCCNSSSITNKKKSLEEIFESKQVDFGIIHEVNTQKPPKIKGYHRFNCLSNKKFHGTVIYVNDRFKGSVAKISDEKFEDEMVHLIVKNVTPTLNIIGVYLEVERGDRERTERVWSHLTVKINSIIERGESISLLGDMNRPMNSLRKSFGTKLLEDWLQTETVALLNDKNIPTRYDPATGKGSVLDLGIISKDIIKNVTNFEVDSYKNWTPFSFKKIGPDSFDKKPSDHCAIMLSMNVTSVKQTYRKKPVINYKNPQGWEKYKDVSNKYAGKIMEAIRDIDDINKLERELELINTDIMIDSFGITWETQGKTKRQKKRESKQIRQLYKEQQVELDEMLSEGYNTKDLNAKIYKLKQMISGPKIKAQEPMCIKDPVTGELITDYEAIKETTLNHATKILIKNDIRDKDKQEHAEKVKNHKRIMDNENIAEWELDRMTYKKVLKRIKEKDKKMFDPLNKAGDLYKEAIRMYMSKIIDNENIPWEFSKTVLIPIWKKKGSALDLNMMRYVHMKSWQAKLCEALVTETMKDDIVKACPKIQIGGIPKSMSVEHLVTVKTWMAMKEQKKENGIFQVFDMAKFFDKESLLDAMYTLDKKGKISNKTYRLWHQLNEDARISVKTSVGETRSKKVKNSLGQGTFGAALVSTLNIGCAIEDTFIGRPSTSIGFVNLNSLVLQDDVNKMNDSLPQARIGCNKIDEILKRKQLSVNYDKSKYLIIGSEKYRKEVLKEVKDSPMMMGNVEIGHSEKEKYLGDFIHEKGIVESISATIKARTNGLISKCDEIIKICESPIMGGTGNSLAAIKLFEAQIIPALLHNCESWLGINQIHLSDLQEFQDKFIRKLLWLPQSTPKAILHWDVDMKLMKWRIAERKLKFVSKIMARENSNITKRVLMSEVLMEDMQKVTIKGLAYECKSLSEELGIPNVVFNKVNKSTIKQATEAIDKKEKRIDMENSKKVGDRLPDNPKDNKIS